MKPKTQKRLFKINQEFYNRFAPSFSATRARVQPGVRKLLPRMLQVGAILDVGCGNGTLARALVENGYQGEYLGVDMSGGLLNAARNALGQPEKGQFTFRRADLAESHWPDALPLGSFDLLVSFAVLHHLPGETFRRQVARTFHDLVVPDGSAVVSVWQWQNSTRLVKRVVPWQEVGLDPSDVDEGDVLLDWRASDQVGLRYVQTSSDESLTALAEEAGFRVVDSFYSDGKPGNLALYQVWEPT
jgi:tRNA (uracil-5-)-methyltransferase TRM9